MFIPTRGDLLTSWVRENRSLSLSICGSHSVWKGRRSRSPSRTLKSHPECWLGETEREPWVLPRGWHFGFLLCASGHLKMSTPLSSFAWQVDPPCQGGWQGLRWVGCSSAPAHLAQTPFFPVELSGHGEGCRKEGKRND